MRIGLSPTRWLAAGIAVVTVSGLAVTADAAVRSGGYSACANDRGELAVLSHGQCPDGTHKVTVGAQGAQGARGARGAQGKSGPSDAYVAITSLDQNVMPTLHVPAGSYLVSWTAISEGSLTVGDTDNFPYTYETFCAPFVSGPGGADGPDGFVRAPMVLQGPADTSPPYDGLVTTSGFWAVTTHHAATLSMSCGDPTVTDYQGANPALDSFQVAGNLEATKVATVHGTDSFPR